jgi:uncharacterized protein
MAGSINGGNKTAQILLERDPDYYKRIGSLGGKKGTTGGFAYAKAHYSEDDPRHPANAGYRGGQISRRNKHDSSNIL